MLCPQCDGPTCVRDTAYTTRYPGARRARECQRCRCRFHTVEVLVETSVKLSINDQQLTTHERRIMECIFAGAIEPKTIAGELNMSTAWVYKHQTKLFRKFHVYSAAQLILRYGSMQETAQRELKSKSLFRQAMSLACELR